MLALPLVSATGDVGPGRVSLSLSWDTKGETQLSVPPLGRVLIDTHHAPTALRARVESIDLDQAQRLGASDAAVTRLEAEARHDVGALVRSLAWRLAVVALVIAVLAAAVVPRHRLRHGLVAGGAVLIVYAGLGAWTWSGFESAAFREPRFEGALQQAPEVLAAVQREFGNLEGVQDRLEVLSGRLTELFALAADPRAGLVSDVRVLHVSDIHSNPLGVEIAAQLAREFDVAAVVDTGDLTSFGQPFESRIGDLVDDVPVPYYLVPGNHDSLANRRALEGYANVTVLDGDVVDIDGVSVLGVADPGVTVGRDGDDATARRARDAQAPLVARDVRRERPDVLAVANLRQARAAYGDVPLVISGDVHRRSERVVDGTRVLTVGSTGATGLGSYTVAPTRPYEAQVLHFRAGRLATLDYVQLAGVTGAFEISRTVFDAG